MLLLWVAWGVVEFVSFFKDEEEGWEKPADVKGTKSASFWELLVMLGWDGADQGRG